MRNGLVRLRSADFRTKLLNVILFLIVALIAKGGFQGDAAASDKSLPSLRMSDGFTLMYDLHQSRHLIIRFKQGEPEPVREIYRGKLTKIQVTSLNGAEIPPGVEVEKVSDPRHIETHFNTATGKSGVVMETGDTFIFDGSIKEVGSIMLKSNRGLISIQHSSGDALTFFFDGHTRRDVNKEFYHGSLTVANQESGSQIFNWGGKPIYYTTTDGKKVNLISQYLSRFSQFLASPPLAPVAGVYVDEPATGVVQNTKIISKELLEQLEKKLRISSGNMDLETAHTLIDMGAHSNQLVPVLTEIALQSEKSGVLWENSTELKSRPIERSVEAVDLLTKYAETDPKALDALYRIKIDSRSEAARNRAIENLFEIERKLPTPWFMKCFMSRISTNLN
jgi:hypothetical protein